MLCLCRLCSETPISQERSHRVRRAVTDLLQCFDRWRRSALQRDELEADCCGWIQRQVQARAIDLRCPNPQCGCKVGRIEGGSSGDNETLRVVLFRSCLLWECLLTNRERGGLALLRLLLLFLDEPHQILGRFGVLLHAFAQQIHRSDLQSIFIHSFTFFTAAKEPSDAALVYSSKAFFRSFSCPSPLYTIAPALHIASAFPRFPDSKKSFSASFLSSFTPSLRSISLHSRSYSPE